MIFCIILDRKKKIAFILDEQCIKLQEISPDKIPSESETESTGEPCNEEMRRRRRDTGCNECCNGDDGESKTGSEYVYMYLSIIWMLHDAYTNYM